MEEKKPHWLRELRATSSVLKSPSIEQKKRENSHPMAMVMGSESSMMHHPIKKQSSKSAKKG